MDRLVRAALASDLAARWLGRKQRGALDRQIAAAIELIRLTKRPPLESMDVARARRVLDAPSPLEFDREPMAEVIDTHAGAVPTRIFVPHGAGRDWLVYFHGGGGVIGSVAGSECAARYLAVRTKLTVASVGYRLAPEAPHPAGVDDANAAWAALVARATAGARIAVGGESFGGYLSAQVDRHSRLRGGRRPDAQLLLYPMIDLTLAQPSIERNASGYLLTKDLLKWFVGHYLPAGADPRAASPWFWPESELRGAAPAVVATAGYDPLVDEGDAWADRLRVAGTTVRHAHEPSLVHSFVSLGGAVRAARAATDRICDELIEVIRSV
jgi:acetyl esterase